MLNRRRFLSAGLALTPLASMLAACGRSNEWPDGMTEIKWDRDTCVRCAMVISDRRFAAELRGGPQKTSFKFDDIGCLVFWMQGKAAEFPWMADAATRLWVADAASKLNETVRWLDVRQARYVGGRTSPMGYNFAAVTANEAGALDFPALQTRLLAQVK